MTDSWPHTVLRPRDVIRRLRARTTAGTTSASGFTQRVSTNAHIWVIEYDGILISTEHELASWDAVEASLDGAANPIYVPLVGDTDGATPGSLVGATAAGQTIVTVRRVGDTVKNGRHFSVGEARLHRIWWIESSAGDDYLCHIRPPLRDAYPDAVALNFLQPYCKCRLASDDEMSLTITPGRFATGAVKFLEDPS
ncbi:MAG TPA: hypothetical protein VEW06_06460 [Xanthobacteraceae bacterium]|nr:hypothetical protein [Xanthobacteraceae bacterium]